MHNIDWWICWYHELIRTTVLISADVMVITPLPGTHRTQGICTFWTVDKGRTHLSLGGSFFFSIGWGKSRLATPYCELRFKRKSLTKISITTSSFHLLPALLSKYAPQICQKIKRKKLYNETSFWINSISVFILKLYWIIIEETH